MKVIFKVFSLLEFNEFLPRNVPPTHSPHSTLAVIGRLTSGVDAESSPAPQHPRTGPRLVLSGLKNKTKEANLNIFSN